MPTKIIQIACVLAGIFISASAAAQFKPGHYYTNDGKKISGLLKFQYGGNLFTNKSDGDCSLVYRASSKTDKQKFTTNDICCFVIEKDSFAIIKNFRLNAFASYPQDFAKVIASGRINLYTYYSVVQSKYGSFTQESWVIEKDGKTDKLSKKKFKELMPVYLSDYPDLAEDVHNKSFAFEDAPEVIKMYNKHSKKMIQEPSTGSNK